MAFFGFENNDLENERQRFLHGGLGEAEDLPEVTWGEESYDGLGDTLQEGGDELNNETFGGSGAVGKDFDFTAQTLPDDLQPPSHQSPSMRSTADMSSFFPKRRQDELTAVPPAPPSASQTPISLESLWDDKPQSSTFQRPPSLMSRHSSAVSGNSFSPFNEADAMNRLPPGLPRHLSSGMRTLEEVEAEMLAASRPQPTRAPSSSLLELERRQAEEYQRQLLRQEQEREMLILQQHQRERERRLLEQQRLIEQQEHEARLIAAEREREQHRMFLLQQQRFQELQMQQRGTPPPRMMPPPARTSQSPRFMEHQRQLLSQQHPDYLHEQRLLLEEQARRDELERQWMEQQAMQLGLRSHARQPSAPSHLDVQELLRNLHASPSLRNDPRYADNFHQPPPGFPEDLPVNFHPSDIDPRERRALDAQADFKIHETERMMEKRNRLRSKIQHMSRYNDLMTQSDKDFITRIQVSQLVTQDPFADDYYAQMYAKQHRQQARIGQEDQRLLKFGSGGGIALGVPQKGSNRRVNAMHRMEQQVERIVNNARKREEEKNQHALTSLQGALGKTSGRSYKAAPRQLLNVDLTHIASESSDVTSPTNEPAADEQNGKEQTPSSPLAMRNGGVALNRRQILMTLEHLYDIDVKLEDLLRKEPSPDDPALAAEWVHIVEENVDQVWKALKIGTHDLDSSVHPVIFLLSAVKGKRLLFKLIGNEKFFNQIQQREFSLALLSNFDQLDIVRMAPLLDTRQESPEQENVERQTTVFEESWEHWILYLVDDFDLKLLAGYLKILMSRNDVLKILRSSVGLTLITLFLTNAHGRLGKQTPLEPDASQSWQEVFHELLTLIHPHLFSLFPSSRLLPATTVMEHARD
ncbi:topoisomerase II-associated protein PAT1 [Flagelloscypha sp. PMI_526]|nr:topoisomerase II-associated protein PAT1 [Flagelloscypha sp. PMI_526]